MPLTKKGKKIKKAMEKPNSQGGYGKKKGEKVFYASANKGTIKGVHGEDIEKYATPDEKLFLEAFYDDEDEVHGENPGLKVFPQPGMDDENWEDAEPEEAAREQNPLGKKWLRRQALKKKLMGMGALEKQLKKLGTYDSGGMNFTQPFDKNGEPRKYLKILLGVESEPGMTKLEIYRDILGRDYTPYQSKGQDTASLWSPLIRAGLIMSKRNGKKIGYYPGPNWEQYKTEILGQETDEFLSGSREPFGEDIEK